MRSLRYLSFYNNIYRVIDAYAKSKVHDAALHAERIFKQMEKVYTNGNKQAKPNVQSFNTGT